MAVKVPNLSDAEYDAQAFPNSVDLDILSAALAGNNVASGGLITAQSVPDMSVHMAAGSFRFSNEPVSLGATDVEVPGPDLDPRRDLVVLSNAPALSIISGDPRAIDPDDPSVVPLLPPVPVGHIGLASIEIPPGLTAVTAAELLDKRGELAIPVPDLGGWTTVAATSNLNRNNTAAATADPVVKFAMAANTKYRFRGVVYFARVSPAFVKWQITGPTAPTFVNLRSRGHSVSFSTVLDATNLDNTIYPAVLQELGNWVEFDGIVHNGSTGGDLAFQWAQQVATAVNTTRYAGSYIEHAVV